MVQTGYCSVAFGKTNISRGSPNTTTRQHACAGWVDRLFEGAVWQFGSLTSTQRPAFHADRVGRCGVAAVRRCGASARTYGWDTVEPPCHARTPRAAVFRLRTAAQTGYGLCLRFVDTVDASDALDRQETPHPSRVSLEADQLDRMATRHVERVGRGCRGRGERVDLGLRHAAPVTPSRFGGAISASDGGTGGVTACTCAFRTRRLFGRSWRNSA